MSETPTTPADATGGLMDLLDPLDSATGTPPPDAEGKKRRRRKAIAWVLGVVLVLFAAIFAWYLVNRKPLSELPGIATNSLPTYQTSIYGVQQPLGVAASPDGSRIYATQSGAKAAVLVFDRSGNKLGELTPPATPQRFHTPVYVTVDATNGNVWVGDRGADRIYVYGPTGRYLSTFTPKDSSVVFSPLGIALAKDGTVYVADVASQDVKKQRILVFAKDGTLLKQLGTGKLNYPNCLVVDAQGNLFVTDSNDGRLVVIDPKGTVTTLVKGGVGDGDLGLPRGLAIDDRGRILVVDLTDHMVRMYAPAEVATTPPTYLGSFGGEGHADGTFEYPNGLGLDARGRVYVTDRGNNRIQVWGF